MPNFSFAFCIMAMILSYPKTRIIITKPTEKFIFPFERFRVRHATPLLRILILGVVAPEM